MNILEQNQFSEFKFVNHIEQLKSLAEGKDIWPKMAEVDLTDSCNHRCKFCIYGDTRVPGAFLKLDDIKNILPQLKDRGVESIVFKGGGEPTISPYFSQAIYYAKNLNFKIGVITNGANLRNENFAAVRNCCEWIRFSLDAASEKTYNKIHNPYRPDYFGFSQVIKNIQNIALADRVIVGINYTTNRDNYQEIEQATILAKSLKVNYICFRTVMCVGDDMPDEIWNEILQIFNTIKQYEERNFKVITRYQKKGFFEHRDWNSCLAPALIVIIQANGDIVTCCDSRGIPEYVFGNIREQSFDDIWKGEKRKQIMGNLLLKKCSQICSDRYGKYNRFISYWQSEKMHNEFV